MEEKVRVRLAGFGGDGVAVGEGVIVTLHQLAGSVAAAQSAVQTARERHEQTARTAVTRPTSESGSKRCIPTGCIRPATGKSYEQPTPKHFSFNSPNGACPVCHGLGQKMVFDEGLVVPDAEKSLEQGAVLPWRRGRQADGRLLQGDVEGGGGALRPEPGSAVQESAGGFQERSAARLGRDGDRISILARGQGRA